MASLELIVFEQPQVVMNGLSDKPQAPIAVQIAGWVYGGDPGSIYVAAALTPDGPRGVTVVPRYSIKTRTALLGYIPAETLTATMIPDDAEKR